MLYVKFKLLNIRHFVILHVVLPLDFFNFQVCWLVGRDNKLLRRILQINSCDSRPTRDIFNLLSFCHHGIQVLLENLRHGKGVLVVFALVLRLRFVDTGLFVLAALLFLADVLGWHY